MLNRCVSSAATSMAMQRPTIADVKKAVAPAIALANVLITAPAFAEGTGEVLPAEYSCLSCTALFYLARTHGVAMGL